MSEISENIDALNHMESALVVMHTAVAAIQTRNATMVKDVIALWGTGNNSAGTTAMDLMRVGEKLEEARTSLHLAQVDVAFSALLMSRVAGSGG